MIEKSFSIFEAITHMATWLLGNSLDTISSIPTIIFLVALLAIVMVFFILILMFGGKIKQWIKKYL